MVLRDDAMLRDGVGRVGAWVPESPLPVRPRPPLPQSCCPSFFWGSKKSLPLPSTPQTEKNKWGQWPGLQEQGTDPATRHWAGEKDAGRGTLSIPSRFRGPGCLVAFSFGAAAEGTPHKHNQPLPRSCDTVRVNDHADHADTEARQRQLMTGSERGPQLQQARHSMLHGLRNKCSSAWRHNVHCRQQTRQAGVVGDSKKCLPGESETRPRPDPAPLSTSPSSARGRASQDSAIGSAHTAPERAGGMARPCGLQRAAGIWTRGIHHPISHLLPMLLSQYICP